MKKIKLKIEDVSQKYDGKLTLKNINLEVYEGEIVVFLGPSGCGKTTLLKSIAGLISIHSGKMYIDGKSIEKLTPQERNTAMIFQNYALFPHMSVRENIEYGLKIRKLDKTHIHKQADKIIKMTNLQDLENRQITQLSGGQQQRVAISRAMIVEPQLMLFDEPLSNLDENLRLKMRREIKKMLKEMNITSIYVTHDQNEAMSIADKIVIMKDGLIQQISSPNNLYYKPINKYVANFIGHTNIYDIQIENGKFRLFDKQFDVQLFTKSDYDEFSNILIPAETIKIITDEKIIDKNMSDYNIKNKDTTIIKAIVKDIESFTSIRKYIVKTKSIDSKSSMNLEIKEMNIPNKFEYAIGDEVLISIDQNNFHYMR